MWYTNEKGLPAAKNSERTTLGPVLVGRLTKCILYHLQACVAFQFRHLVPTVFARWKAYAVFEKKSKYAWFVGLRRIARRYLELWKKARDDAWWERQGSGRVLSTCNGKVAHSEVHGESWQHENELGSGVDSYELVGEGEVGQVNGTGKYKLPKLSDEELLERWRDDEKWRLAGIGVAHKEKMETMTLMQGMRGDKLRRDEDHIILEEFHDEKAYSLGTVLDRQSDQSKARRRNVMDYMANVKAMRARFLHDVLDRVIEEQNQKYTIDLAARCLRRLRVQMMQRNAMAFFKRSRLKNWCRLAARFRYLDRGMPVYRKYRVLWKMWQKWLRFLRKQYMYIQPSLGHEIRRRKELLCKFSNLLDNGMPEEEASSGVKTLFYRWLEHTQSQCVRRRLVKVLGICRGARLLHRAFGALQCSRKVRYASLTPSRIL